MKIERVVVGELEENCYILKNEGQALIVDPGSDFLRIKKQVGECRVLKILITHHHFDHIGALSECLQNYPVEVIDFTSYHEKEYRVGAFQFQLIPTPGHSSDSVSFYFPKERIMFVGDFVFKETIGRCDLPTGNDQEMKKSICKLVQYSSDIILYPGHGEATTIKNEKENNPYFT